MNIDQLLNYSVPAVRLGAAAYILGRTHNPFTQHSTSSVDWQTGYNLAKQVWDENDPIPESQLLNDIKNSTFMIADPTGKKALEPLRDAINRACQGTDNDL